MAGSCVELTKWLVRGLTNKVAGPCVEQQSDWSVCSINKVAGPCVELTMWLVRVLK